MNARQTGGARRAAETPRVRRSWPAGAVTVTLLVGAFFIFAGVGPDGALGNKAAAVRAAREFLRRYVEPDGRVVRRDQGGDSVSEGQAYGLLLADTLRDRSAFSRIWNWTRAHLQRPDGLLASLTNQAGAVINPTPASDADLLTAWALSMTSGPSAAYYHAQANRLADAVLADETATRGGARMLAAGPWATGNPVSLNPSYWSFEAYEGLARFTGDARWNELSRSSFELARVLSRHGRELPPDWARVDGTVATPTPAPDGRVPWVEYGLNAQRLVVWLAASCQPGRPQLAARWWRLLAPPNQSHAITLLPNGRVVDSDTNALPFVAAAAAASASHDLSARERLLAAAARAQAAHSTYYGAAWLALGRMLLTTSALGGCAGSNAQ